MENDRRSGSGSTGIFFIFSLKIVRKLKFYKFGSVHAYFTLYFPLLCVYITSYEVWKVIIGDIQVDLKWSVGTAKPDMVTSVMAELSEG